MRPAGTPAEAPCARVQQLLTQRGLSWPGPLVRFSELGSTNDWLKERCRAGEAEEWQVVWADSQTAGRGRQARAWCSPVGNAYFSVLLLPTAAELGGLPLLAGVAVAEALQEWRLGARLKWPNDVLVEERKIAGILVETCRSRRRLAAVVGIGVNVNTVPGAADLAVAATSIAAETGRPWACSEVLTACLARLRLGWEELKRGGRAAAVAAWRDLAVAWWGRPIEVWAHGQPLRGIAIDVQDDGALLIELPGGERRPVYAGEARALRLGGGE